MMKSCASRSAVTDNHCGKRLLSLADVRQFVDVLDPARLPLKTSGFKAGSDRNTKLGAQRKPARATSSGRVRQIGRVDPIDDVGRGVTEHPLGANV